MTPAPEDRPSAGTQVGEHLDDEHDPGGPGFGGCPETLLKRGRWPMAYPLAVLALEEAGKGWLRVVPHTCNKQKGRREDGESEQ